MSHKRLVKSVVYVLGCIFLFFVFIGFHSHIQADNFDNGYEKLDRALAEKLERRLVKFLDVVDGYHTLIQPKVYISLQGKIKTYQPRYENNSDIFLMLSIIYTIADYKLDTDLNITNTELISHVIYGGEIMNESNSSTGNAGSNNSYVSEPIANESNSSTGNAESNNPYVSEPIANESNSSAGNAESNNSYVSEPIVNESNSSTIMNEKDIGVCTFNGKEFSDKDFLILFQTETVYSPNQCVSEVRTCMDGDFTGSYEYESCDVKNASEKIVELSNFTKGDSLEAAVINSQILMEAINAGNSIVIPDGEFYLKEDSFIIKEAVTIEGSSQNGTILNFLSSETKYKELFKISKPNVTFKDMTINYMALENESAQLFVVNSDSFEINNVTITGNNTIDKHNLVNGFTFTNNDVDGFRIVNSDIGFLQRVIFRKNSALGNIKDVQIHNNEIHDLGQGGIQFNTPKGSASDVSIKANRFHDFHRGTEQIFIGTASGHNFVIENNRFTGTAKNCIHLEENARNILIKGNKCSTNYIGVFVNDNNVSGIAEHPTEIIIEDNLFVNTSETKTGDGINATVNKTEITAFGDITIRNNSFHNYDNAINLDKGSYSVTNNIIKNCNIGVKLWGDLDGIIRDNSYTDCETEILPRGN